MTPDHARFTLLPAVDIAGGRAAQVVRGTDDPYAVAMGWVDQGASWLHLVDLDRAFGRGENAELLASLIDRLPVRVQLSGGLADEKAVRWAASTGAERFVLASSTLADRLLIAALIEQHGDDRVVPAVDVRDGRVVSRGTDLELGSLEEVLTEVPELTAGRHLLVADASRDGSRRGSDVELFGRVAAQGSAGVIASGGVASLSDLRELQSLAEERVTGAVLGAALYHGTFTLAEALEVCS
ncbi:HisA/HisF-related TIM barrel protein [Ornithinimicrobium sp. Y1694]|uniref:1-(5-phosphoribosyl)-5-[(5- phosphoribosylamino)methylideneamino]imidazole-4- carboxamide isomerase n=1 Tax=Ornithinimicrobium sp. Y1694 TaxID=3418590 RepID=UPI003CF76309